MSSLECKRIRANVVQVCKTLVQTNVGNVKSEVHLAQDVGETKGHPKKLYKQ